MAEERVERRLAAILAADVAGYSRLMGGDEDGTFAALKALYKSVIDPKVAEHRGRIVKTTGDGALVEFASVVDAAHCAVDIQRGMAERNAEVPQEALIEFRIGIHVGDIIIDDNDIFGDGVNIASRIEGIAEPGGVCISDDAYRQIRSKLDITCDDMGPQTLKNIAEPMRAWRMRVGTGGGRATLANPSAGHAQALALPDKPSIAVLPFQNMSGDRQQEYFADGMVEDIITELSRFRQLFVIARNSSFTYKGRAVDVRQVGRDLGVRYVLEGSVRKAANRVRITGQLIDTATGTHIWADHFDGTLEDIFDLQDRVTTSVVGAIAPKLDQAEIARAKRKPTESLDAYDYYLRGLACFRQWTRESNAEALPLFYKAIELDPDFAAAYGMASWCYGQRKSSGWVKIGAQDTAETARLVERAIQLGRDDALALCTAGFALAFVVSDLYRGVAAIDRALVLNPNLAIAWRFSGLMRIWLGEPELALEHLKHAMRLSPFDPTIHNFYASIAIAHFCAGRYKEASSWAEKATSAQPNYNVGLRISAASDALAGSLEKAQKAMAHLRQLDPMLRVSNLTEALALRRPDDIARFKEGMRKAGLPE